jgi:nucleotide-binding universal stress UspA family protein
MKYLGSRTEVSLRNILFATDFSSSSDAAMPYGLGLSRRYDATLYTVSVVSAEITYDAKPPDPFYHRHCAEKKMAQLVSSELFQGIKHREFVKEEFDSASRVLLKFIDRHHVDLVVLGLHGRGGIKKLVLGSVAEEIVNSAPCAVLTVGPHVPQGSGSGWKLRRILCATDLTPGSASALNYALRLAKDEQAHLTVLHVLKMPTDIPAEEREAQKDTAVTQLVRILSSEMGSSTEAQPVVEIGAPAERILKVAEDRSADLIVIGPHHTVHPRIYAHLPWAMVHRVLTHAQCPVLRV